MAKKTRLDAMKSLTSRLQDQAIDAVPQADTADAMIVDRLGPSASLITPQKTKASEVQHLSSTTMTERPSLLLWPLCVLGLLAAGAGLIYCILNLFSVWQPKAVVWADTTTITWLGIWALLVGALAAVAWHLIWPFVRALRQGAPALVPEGLNNLSLYLARSVFWVLVFVGIVEIALALPTMLGGNLTGTFGEELGKNLIRQDFRGPFIHFPLVFAGFIVGAFTKGPSFIWLSLLIVLAELSSAIASNVFSFTNVFIGDLVRMWYVGLFLLSAGYTLVEGGHVRVDVLYAGLGQRAKNWVNFLGCFIFGLPLAWVILAIGARGSRTAINGALSSLDKGPSGAGLLTQYFLAFIFMSMACILVVQFSAYFVTYGNKILNTRKTVAEKDQA